MKSEKVIFNRLLEDDPSVCHKSDSSALHRTELSDIRREKFTNSFTQNDKITKFKSNIWMLIITLAIILLSLMSIGFILIQRNLDKQIDLFEYRIDSVFASINTEKEKIRNEINRLINLNHTSHKNINKRNIEDNIINGDLEIEIVKPVFLNKYCANIKDACLTDFMGPVGPPGLPGKPGIPGLPGMKGIYQNKN